MKSIYAHRIIQSIIWLFDQTAKYKVISLLVICCTQVASLMSMDEEAKYPQKLTIKHLAKQHYQLADDSKAVSIKQQLPLVDTFTKDADRQLDSYISSQDLSTVAQEIAQSESRLLKLNKLLQSFHERSRREALAVAILEQLERLVLLKDKVAIKITQKLTQEKAFIDDMKDWISKTPQNLRIAIENIAEHELRIKNLYRTLPLLHKSPWKPYITHTIESLSIELVDLYRRIVDREASHIQNLRQHIYNLTDIQADEAYETPHMIADIEEIAAILEMLKAQLPQEPRDIFSLIKQDITAQLNLLPELISQLVTQLINDASFLMREHALRNTSTSADQLMTDVYLMREISNLQEAYNSIIATRFTDPRLPQLYAQIARLKEETRYS